MSWEIYTLGFDKDALFHAQQTGDGEPFFVDRQTLGGGARVWCRRNTQDSPTPPAFPSDTRSFIKGQVYKAKVGLVNGKAREAVFNELERALLTILGRT